MFTMQFWNFCICISAVGANYQVLHLQATVSKFPLFLKNFYFLTLDKIIHRFDASYYCNKRQSSIKKPFGFSKYARTTISGGWQAVHFMNLNLQQDVPLITISKHSWRAGVLLNIGKDRNQPVYFSFEWVSMSFLSLLDLSRIGLMKITWTKKVNFKRNILLPYS